MLINFIILNILRKFNYAKGVALDGGVGVQYILDRRIKKDEG